MNLIVLYGPPGVGKLTVAKELAKLTDYKVFHNHLTIEPLAALFEWGSKPYNRLVHKLRFELLEAAARAKVKGVIFTFVYAAEADDVELHQLVHLMKRNKSETFFVQLTCNQQELEKRITKRDRRQYNKIRHIKNLRHLMNKYETMKVAPFPNTISINNTNLSARLAAVIIKRHWKL